MLGEIDAAALAETCALIAEVKTTLSDEALLQLIRLLDTIRCDRNFIAFWLL